MSRVNGPASSPVQRCVSRRHRCFKVEAVRPTEGSHIGRDDRLRLQPGQRLVQVVFFTGCNGEVMHRGMPLQCKASVCQAQVVQ